MQKDIDIYIVGTTAVGKTALSLALAKHLKSEIISCDSMQLYKHADIMTAKVTTEEKQQARHHMIDVLNLDQAGYNRNKYYDMASIVMMDLHANNKIPIIVGGTNYYIETLLFDLPAPAKLEPTAQQQKIIDELLKKQPGQKYKYLCEVDKAMADKIHEHDHHRLDAYLKKYIITGQKPSLSYIKPTNKLRNPNTLLFWIRNSDRTELINTMRSRIEKMVDKQGILQILSLFSCIKQQNYEGGVLQSIGYKEFRAFHEALNLKIPQHLQTYEQIYSHLSSHYDELGIEKHQDILQKCKDELVLSTSQYAKRQVTWIRNRLFGTQQNNHNFHVLQLDGKGPLAERFKTQVQEKVIKIVDSAISNGIQSVMGGLPPQQAKNRMKVNKEVGQWKKHHCQICQRELNGETEWKQHLRSARHKRKVKTAQKARNDADSSQQL